MLIDAYIAAILSNEKAADLIWELWNDGHISDALARMAWCIVALDLDRDEEADCCNEYLLFSCCYWQGHYWLPNSVGRSSE